MAIEFDHAQSLINITSPQDTLTCQDLIDAIRTQEATTEGIQHPQIAFASGKEDLGAGVQVGITVELVSPWQVKFAENGDYIAKITGGNLVGGVGGDPVAYTNGVQVLLVQSASSTIVDGGGGSGGGGLTTEEHNKLMGLPDEVGLATDERAKLMGLPDTSGLTVEERAKLLGLPDSSQIATDVWGYER